MSHDGSLLQATVIFLLAVVLLVPLAQRLKLGAVPGYLLAGILIGPSILGLITNAQNVSRLSEMGVVMLLFIIGLELSPRRLWMMRRALFGVGLLQVLLTGLAIGAVAFLLGQSLQVSIVLGLGLALSSTAFGLQILAERKELGRPHGRLAVAILLFQDIAAIPLIALVPLLGASSSGGDEGEGMKPILAVIAAIGLIILGGRYLLRPAFDRAIGSGLRELSTATALLLVLGTAWIMEHVGVSMALGAFLAGVLMAESEYRHELESQIEPFKGLLLGLFFVGVGMSMDMHLLLREPLAVLGLTLLLVGIKLPLLVGLGRLVGGLDRAGAVCLGVVLASGGEFAFVVFTLALEHRLLDQRVHDLLVLAIALSMALVPLIMLSLARMLQPHARAPTTPLSPSLLVPQVDGAPRVVIAGTGHMGREIAGLLQGQGITLVTLDTLSKPVDQALDGASTSDGDPVLPDALQAAKVGDAQLVIVTCEDPQISFDTTQMLVGLFPATRIIARAHDSEHALRLLGLGASPVRETFQASLELARRALLALGVEHVQTAAWVQSCQIQEEQRLPALLGTNDGAAPRDTEQTDASARPINSPQKR